MRGTVAKRLRREHYKERSLRARGYDTAPNGMIFSDDVRYLFQKKKKLYLEMKGKK